MSAPIYAGNRTETRADMVIEQTLAWLRERLAPHAALCADTRRLRAGDVFLAYPVGNDRQRSDNRARIAQAFEAGAAAVLYDRADGFVPPAGVPGELLGVEDLAMLAGPLASRWLDDPSRRMRVIGVTGTNGKTSVTQWLAQAFDHRGQRCAIVGTLGTGFVEGLQPTGYTTPDAPQLQHSLHALYRLGARAAAMEVSSHGLDQGRVDGTVFDTAVFTNLTQDHLDYHGTMNEYAAAKARLFKWPSLRCAVINVDDEFGRELFDALPADVLGIATRIVETDRPLPAPGRVCLQAAEVCSTGVGTRFRLRARLQGRDYEANVSTPLLGAFNVSNLLAVLGVLLGAGIDWSAALAEIEALQPVCGRMEQIGGHGGPLVVVDYAHTADALDKTLRALQPVANVREGRLWCVFGCGGNRDSGKRPQMGAVAERLADVLVLTSDNPRDESSAQIVEQIAAGLARPDAARHIDDRAAAILHAVRNAAPQDVVLVAGKGHETTQEIAGRKLPFRDQEHVRLALAARGVLA